MFRLLLVRLKVRLFFIFSYTYLSAYYLEVGATLYTQSITLATYYPVESYPPTKIIHAGHLNKLHRLKIQRISNPNNVQKRTNNPYILSPKKSLIRIPKSKI